MKLLDKIQTPDDWKDRAKKIAQGKGIYAKVKTGGWWKAAIAAALALVIGAEGFLLLREDKGDKADKEKITVPTMTDSREAHETENSLLVKQMSYYYPRATEERCKELAAELRKNGCGLIYTRDNGIAQSCSQELAAHTEDVPYYQGIVERGASVYFSDFDYQKRKMDLEKLSDASKKDGDTDLMGDVDPSMLPRPNNDEINKKLYREAAYAMTIALPTIISIVGFLICLIALYMHFN